jgi:iron complex transport system permease protein
MTATDPVSGARPVQGTPSRCWWLAVGVAVLVTASAAALTAGAYRISLSDLWRLLTGSGAVSSGGDGQSAVAAAVIWNLRMPRVLLAIVVGGALAASGAVFQACFRNPLVEPYILGVSSGAAFGAALGMVVPRFPLSIQLAAFLGAVAAVGLVHGLARGRGDAPVVTLVLSGVIIGSMFAAGVSMLKYLANEAALRDIVFWLMGGFYFASWQDAAVVVPAVAIASVVMVEGGWTLNVLAMGDDEARALGIEPRRARATLLAAATVATAVSVSAVGIVPWVGLMTPHAARMVLGPDNRLVVPGSALLGALFLLACDTAARSLTSAEIPVGIITALAGGPFLAYLVRQRTSGLFG